MTKYLPCFLLLLGYTDLLSQKDCRQDDYQRFLIRLHPSVAVAYQKIELYSQQRLRAFTGSRSDTGSLPSTSPVAIVPNQINIPVVIHVLWNNSAQNISNARILSQLAVLNQDFEAMNSDRSMIPAYFRDFAADCGIHFELAHTDPDGNPTNGILRKQTGRQIFGFDDKAKSRAMDGDDAWNADNYLNIWVCNLEPGISGYASAPGCPKENDGVVISTSVFGIINGIGPFNKGRTAVHEIGHWLNLRHIWGDANCGDDMVDDTPSQQAASRGCNSGEKFSCGTTAHGDMYMNYMDFSDDACMYMFTQGQRKRMRVLFETGGARNTLLSAKGLEGNGLPPDSLNGTEAGNYDLLLYPIPARSAITLQWKGHSNSIGKKIFIYNQLGQVIKSIGCTATCQQLDISSYYAGLYFIRIEGAETNRVQKFIKQ